MKFIKKISTCIIIASVLGLAIGGFTVAKADPVDDSTLSSTYIQPLSPPAYDDDEMK